MLCMYCMCFWNEQQKPHQASDRAHQCDDDCAHIGALNGVCVGSGHGLDMEKVRCTLRQFVRDWSKNGEAERQQCYEVRA
jgi:hypothetical protein